MDLHLLVFVVAICTVFFGCNAKTSMEDCNPTFEVTANSVIYFAEGGGHSVDFRRMERLLGFKSRPTARLNPFRRPVMKALLLSQSPRKIRSQNT
jgi:hypothetical protein